MLKTMLVGALLSLCAAIALPAHGANGWAHFGGVRFGCNGPVNAQLWLPDGSLVVGGRFSACGDAAASSIARWDGAAWSSLGEGVQGEVHALAWFRGALYVGGRFQSVAGSLVSQNLAKFRNGAWEALAPGAPDSGFAVVRTLAATADELYVGGGFSSIRGVPASCIARFSDDLPEPVIVNGVNGVGGGPFGCEVKVIHPDAGTWVVGGKFDTAGDLSALNVARLAGASWQPLGLGLGGGSRLPEVNAIQRFGADLYVTGLFERAYSDPSTSTPVAHLARWSAGAWWPVSGGLTDANDIGYALAEGADGLYVGGRIRSVVAGAANGLVRLQGSGALVPVSGAPGVVYTLSADPQDASIHLGGPFRHVPGGPLVNAIARHASGFSSLGAGTANGVNGPIRAVVMHQGQIHIGGSFALAGGTQVVSLARWDQGAWHPVQPVWMGTREGTVRALLSQGEDLYVAGEFDRVGDTPAAAVAKITGSQVTAMSLDTFLVPVVRALAWYQGEPVIGGRFASVGGQVLNNIARWDGTAWRPLGEGVRTNLPSPEVRALAVWNDRLLVGGTFELAGSVQTRNIAAWDGVEWSILADGISTTPFSEVSAITAYAGRVVVGGSLTGVGGSPFDHLAVLEAGAWSPLLPSWSAPVSAATGTDRRLYVSSSGRLDQNGDRLYRHAAWNGSVWQSLGVSSTDDGSAHAILETPLGLAFVGDFTSIGGAPSSGIALLVGADDALFMNGFE